MIKNLPAIAGDTEDAGSIPGLEDPLEKETATHPMDRGAWWATQSMRSKQVE